MAMGRQRGIPTALGDWKDKVADLAIRGVPVVFGVMRTCGAALSADEATPRMVHHPSSSSHRGFRAC